MTNLGVLVEEHKSFLLTRPELAENPELWNVGLEDLSDQGMQSLGVDWDYDDRFWRVDVREYQTPTIGTGQGLRGRYYNTESFGDLAVTRIDPLVNFNWNDGSPSQYVEADNFSVWWTGWVEAKYTDAYTFHTVSDDGVRLWVNGELIIDNWTDHGPTEDRGTIELAAGQKYTIVMDYYEKGGGATAQLFWSSEWQVKELIPQSQLYKNISTGVSIFSDYDDDYALRNDAVTFYADPDEEALWDTVEWDFGYDGTTFNVMATTTELEATHAFATKGTRNVAVRLSYGTTSRSVGSMSIKIWPLPPILGDEADINTSAGQTVELSLDVTYQESGLSDATSSVEWWASADGEEWYLDDTQTKFTKQVTFQEYGTFDYWVQVTDANGESASVSFTVNVENALPNGGLTYAGPLAEGSELTFSVYAADPATGDDLDIWVDWNGDGSSYLATAEATSMGSVWFSLTHTYTDDGEYTPTCWVVDSAGESAMRTATLQIADVAPTAVLRREGAIGPPTPTISLVAGELLVLTADDPGKRDREAGFAYWYRVDGGAWKKSDGPQFALPAYTAGSTYAVEAYVADKGGVASGVVSAQVTVAVPTHGTPTGRGVVVPAIHGAFVPFQVPVPSNYNYYDTARTQNINKLVPTDTPTGLRAEFFLDERTEKLFAHLEAGAFMEYTYHAALGGTAVHRTYRTGTDDDQPNYLTLGSHTFGSNSVNPVTATISIKRVVNGQEIELFRSPVYRVTFYTEPSVAESIIDGFEQAALYAGAAVNDLAETINGVRSYVVKKISDATETIAYYVDQAGKQLVKIGDAVVDLAKDVADSVVDKLHAAGATIKQLAELAEKFGSKAGDILRAFVSDPGRLIDTLQKGVEHAFDLVKRDIEAEATSAVFKWALGNTVQEADLPQDWTHADQVLKFALKYTGLTLENLQAKFINAVGAGNAALILKFSEGLQPFLNDPENAVYNYLRSGGLAIPGFSAAGIRKQIVDEAMKQIQAELPNVGVQIAKKFVPGVGAILTIIDTVKWLDNQGDALKGVLNKMVEAADKLATYKHDELGEKLAEGVFSAIGPLLTFASAQLKLDKVPGRIQAAVKVVPDKVDQALKTGFGNLANSIKQTLGVAAGADDLFKGLVGKPAKFEYGGVNYLVFALLDKGAGGIPRVTVKVATDEATPKFVIALDDKQLKDRPGLDPIWRNVQELGKQVQAKIDEKKLGEARSQNDSVATLLGTLPGLLHTHGCAALNAGCFCAGTLVWTATGYRPVEELAVGDMVLSRDQYEPAGEILARPVEAIFRRLGSVLVLGLEGGLELRTTPEHPFFTDGHGWAEAGSLRPGMRLLVASGAWQAVERVTDTGEHEEVYNCRVAEFHTYFVGGEGVEVWAHNAYLQLAERVKFAPPAESSLTLTTTQSDRLMAATLKHRQDTNTGGGRNVAAVEVLLSTGTEYWSATSDAVAVRRYKLDGGAWVYLGIIDGIRRSDAGVGGADGLWVDESHVHSERVLLAALHKTAKANAAGEYQLKGMYTELAPCGKEGAANCANILSEWSKGKGKVGRAFRPHNLHVATDRVYYSRLYPNKVGEPNPRKFHMAHHEKVNNLVVKKTAASLAEALSQAETYENKLLTKGTLLQKTCDLPSVGDQGKTITDWT